MLTKLLQPIEEQASRPPVFHRSRCLRMRHRDNGCARCLEVCPRQALRFPQNPPVDEAACSSCYQCTAACPTDALGVADFDFDQCLREAEAADNPVIGCSASRTRMCIPVPCLGLLSEFHFTALALLRKKVTLDLEPCRQCARGPGPTVQNRLAQLLTLLPLENSGCLRLQTEAEPLPPATRRDFFAALRSTVFRQVTTAIRQDPPSPAAYADKALPYKRHLVNEALRSATAQEREKAARLFYFALAVSETCNLCFTCLAACPTGALRKKKEGESRSLEFQSARCSGCGLCTDICRKQAILLRPAGKAVALFSWRTLAGGNQVDASEPALP